MQIEGDDEDDEDGWWREKDKSESKKMIVNRLHKHLNDVQRRWEINSK